MSWGRISVDFYDDFVHNWSQSLLSASSITDFPDNIVGSSAFFSPVYLLLLFKWIALIRVVTFFMEGKSIKGVGESCWKSCCASIAIILRRTAVPHQGSFSAPGLACLGKNHEVAVRLYLLCSFEGKMSENFHLFPFCLSGKVSLLQDFLSLSQNRAPLRLPLDFFGFILACSFSLWFLRLPLA